MSIQIVSYNFKTFDTQVLKIIKETSTNTSINLLMLLFYFIIILQFPLIVTSKHVTYSRHKLNDTRLSYLRFFSSLLRSVSDLKLPVILDSTISP